MRFSTKKLVLLLLLSLTALSCKRRDFICECSGSNSTFQNVFFNATKKEAQDLCDAAEVKFEPGNPGLECVLFEKED